MRANKVTIIIGRRGCGKTTYTLRLISALKSRHGKIIIFDTFDNESYSHFPIIDYQYLAAFKGGIVRVMVSEFNFETVLEFIKNHVRNSCLIFEDAGKYIVGTVGEQFRNVLLDTKQKNVDVIIQYHGVGDVPPRLFRYADFITLFKINDNLQAYKTKIPSYPVFAAAYKNVMALPDGKYPLFPHLTFQIN